MQRTRKKRWSFIRSIKLERKKMYVCARAPIETGPPATHNLKIIINTAYSSLILLIIRLVIFKIEFNFQHQLRGTQFKINHEAICIFREYFED